MVELRKRPAPKEQPASEPAAKRGSGAGSKMKKVVDKAKAKVGGGAGMFHVYLFVSYVYLDDLND